MLKALAILRSIDMDSIGNQESDTHPAVEKRIQKIMNRHAIQPGQLKMDLEFNRTVFRIMNAVEQFVEEFFELEGRNIIAKLKELSTGWPD